MIEEQQGKIQHIVRIPVPAPENEKEAIKILERDLTIPNKNTKGIVLFAHGSGSSRYSTRNQFVAKALNNDGLATLLVDLLTPQEEESDIRMRKIQSKIPGLVLNKFNIRLLSKRLTSIIDWILANAETQSHIIGLFGASTGAAAALVAAGQKPYTMSAIVSRSGRPDLAGQEALNKVQAPTLFIVGSNDDKSAIDLNNKTLNQLVNVLKLFLVLWVLTR
jgi:putative phosphoribosyl transferase